jgi:hypothetical protein
MKDSKMRPTIKKNPKPMLGRQYAPPVKRLELWEIVTLAATAALIVLYLY